MNLVIIDGVQYDADKLPPHLADRADEAVPADEWFKKNAKTKPADKPAAKKAAAKKSAAKKAEPKE